MAEPALKRDVSPVIVTGEFVEDSASLEHRDGDVLARFGETLWRSWKVAADHALATVQLNFAAAAALSLPALLLVPRIGGPSRIKVTRVSPTRIMIELVGVEGSMEAETTVRDDEVRLLEILAYDRDRHLLSPETDAAAREAVRAALRRSQPLIDAEVRRRAAGAS